MAIHFGDGRRAVDNASAVLAMRDIPPRMRGLATREMASGYALAGDDDASSRACDEAMRLLSQPERADDAVFGPQTMTSDEFFTIIRATCDIYLGRGTSVVPVLEPLLGSLPASSARWATITRAQLARAYANIGQPQEAARLALEALDGSERLGSMTARSELRRALPLLSRWRGYEEVQLVMRRLTPSARAGSTQDVLLSHCRRPA